MDLKKYRPLKVYLASSWRNPRYEKVREILLKEGYDVYDFKDPVSAFTWEQLDPNCKNWTPSEFIHKLYSMVPHTAFYSYDMRALRECDVCILLLPCGRSAHLELGYAVGAGKKTMIFFDEKLDDADLMYIMVDDLITSTRKVLKLLEVYQKELNNNTLYTELMDIKDAATLAACIGEFTDVALAYEEFIRKYLIKDLH